MGGTLVQHDKAKELVAGMENGFKRLLLALKEREPTETVRILLNFFGGLAGAALIGILLMGVLRMHSQQLAAVLSVTFAISGILSGSLFWVQRHKVVLRQVGRWLLFFGGGSLLFPAMDVLANAGATHVVYSMMQSSFAPFVDLPNGNGLIYEALVVSGFYAGFVVFFYVVAWFYAAPIALVAWVIVAIPILGARAVYLAFPKKPIAIIFFALWLISLLYLAYASSP